MASRGKLLSIIVLVGVVATWGLVQELLNPRIGHAAANGAILSGVVKSASGEKMEGVAVSAKEEGTNIRTTVFTDEQGQYYLPPLPGGKYHMMAQADSFDTGYADVDLGSSAAHQDFSLNPAKDFVKQLTGDQVIASLPEDTPQHRRMKDVVQSNCTGCHPPNFILQNRFDEAGWTAILNLMTKIVGASGNYGGPDQTPWPVMNYYKKDLAAYLAEMRGPGTSGMQIKLRPRPRGDAAMAVITEYNIPFDRDGGYGDTVNDGSDWSLGTPTSLDGNGGIHDTYPDLNGNIWFTYNDPSSDRTYGMVDPKTGEVFNFKVNGRNGLAAGTHGLTRGKDGILWLNISGLGTSEGSMGAEEGGSGSLGRIDPNTKKLDIFTPPKPMAGVGGILDVDAKGYVWTVTNTGALRFDPQNHQFQEFKSVTQKTGAGIPETYGVAGDSDGNGWWTQILVDLFDKGDAATGESQQFVVPPHKYISENVLTPEEKKMYSEAGVMAPNQTTPWNQAPRRDAADKNGDTVWICDFWGDSLIKVDIHTKKMSFYQVPTPAAGPYDPVVDSNHNVWMNLSHADRIEKFDPKTETWTQYNLPTLGGDTRDVSILERDGRVEIVVPYTRINKIARLNFRTKEDLQALKSQAREVASNSGK